MLLLLLAAAHAISPQPLRIAAAANLQGTLEEVVAAWSSSCDGCKANVTYGASGTLAAQIENGAPFDLYLAADARYPQKVAEAGYAEGAPFIYARGKLALWVPSASTLPIEQLGLEALKDASRVVIANPALAPYGKLAIEALKVARQEDPRRLLLAESVAQAAQQAQSGAVDAALLPLSLVLRMPGRHIELASAIEQGGVVLRGAHDLRLARAFADFLLSPVARKILARHGYA
ncbi:MAG TPA: molybdate ABC transporter substrate-binding protein [Myxococcales bacterium]|jgi:molybdate transport system substrate-binding protein